MYIYICESLYLPQPVHDFSVFRETLEELEVSLAKYISVRRVLIGFDANSRMGYFDDDVHVGGSTIRSAPEAKNSERAAALLEFLSLFGVRLVNTFVELSSENNLVTFLGWSGTCKSQIYFVACSTDMCCTFAQVDVDLSFSTNHRAIYAYFGVELPVFSSKHYGVRNWRPSDTWHQAARLCDQSFTN